jgi:hypothetical protein
MLLLLALSVSIFFLNAGWTWGVLIGAIDVLLIGLGFMQLEGTISSYDTKQVASEVGKINVQEEIQVDGHSMHAMTGWIYHYSINDIKLPGPPKSSIPFPLVNHRVFYLPGNTKEFMSIEPCVDCSPQTEP